MRIPRAVSSVGRAPARQAGGHWFEPSTAHCTEALLTRGFRLLDGNTLRAWEQNGTPRFLAEALGDPWRQGRDALAVGTDGREPPRAREIDAPRSGHERRRASGLLCKRQVTP